MKTATESKLTIVIVNYRTPALVRACLASLEPEREAMLFHVVVVDNASEDGSAVEIEREIEARQWSDWIVLVRSAVNRGFSAGNNIGVRARPSSAYLLLNSDTLVRPGAIRELMHALDDHPAVGILGPRLEWEDGSPQVSSFRWPRPRTELLKAAATGPVTWLFKQAEVALGVFDEPVEPEWVSFAAVLIRHEVVQQIGLLDEGYFMYFEDIDYCRRAYGAGWRILHWPAARVVHLRGGTSPVKLLALAKQRRPAYYYAARARYYAKYYGRTGLWRSNLYWILGRCVSLGREIVQGRPRTSCEGEWRDNWVNAFRRPDSGSSPAHDHDVKRNPATHSEVQACGVGGKPASLGNGRPHADLS